jgi:transcription antitermination factor NusG
VQLVAQAFHCHSDDVQTRRAGARLVPHALAALGHAETLQVAQQVTGPLRAQVLLFLPEGIRVRVRRGVLAGLEGIVVATKARHRVVLRVDLLEQPVAVDIDRADIEPLNSEAE